MPRAERPKMRTASNVAVERIQAAPLRATLSPIRSTRLSDAMVAESRVRESPIRTVGADNALILKVWNSALLPGLALMEIDPPVASMFGDPPREPRMYTPRPAWPSPSTWRSAPPLTLRKVLEPASIITPAAPAAL